MGLIKAKRIKKWTFYRRDEKRIAEPAGCSVSPSSVGREQIAATEVLIRPYIRFTPVVEVDGRDFGLPGLTLVLKLELLQRSGSFKARGAFANLLLREAPAAGVVAASGGNHGAAVAHAARDLEILFVDVFAEAGRHARFAVGVASLPARVAVEVAAVLSVRA